MITELLCYQCYYLTLLPNQFSVWTFIKYTHNKVKNFGEKANFLIFLAHIYYSIKKYSNHKENVTLNLREKYTFRSLWGPKECFLQIICLNGVCMQRRRENYYPKSIYFQQIS